MYIALILVMARVYFINRLLMTTCSNAFPPHPPGSSLALRIRLLPHSSTHSLSTSCDVGSYAPFSADNVMADPHTTNTRTSQSIAWSTKRVKEWPVRLSHQCATTSKSGNDEHELKIIAQSNYCHLDRYLAASHGRSSSVCPEFGSEGIDFLQLYVVTLHGKCYAVSRKHACSAFDYTPYSESHLQVPRRHVKRKYVLTHRFHKLRLSFPLRWIVYDAISTCSESLLSKRADLTRIRYSGRQ